MPAVARGLPRRLPTHPLQRRLGLLLCGREHAFGQFHIRERQIELVKRQLLGAFAKPLALRRAQDALQPTVGLLHLEQRRLDLVEELRL